MAMYVRMPEYPIYCYYAGEGHSQGHKGYSKGHIFPTRE